MHLVAKKLISVDSRFCQPIQGVAQSKKNTLVSLISLLLPQFIPGSSENMSQTCAHFSISSATRAHYPTGSHIAISCLDGSLVLAPPSAPTLAHPVASTIFDNVSQSNHSPQNPPIASQLTQNSSIALGRVL